MSVPPLYSQQRPSAESMEDCRDYLRTGRCKYGGSCKYNHPANVQSGGGLKGPVDPNEPLFPVRPNEPPCQYYMKHGSCKFGQACKFNHPPPQTPLKAVVNGNSSNTVMVNIGRNNEGSHQLVLNPVATDSNGNLMMLQFLPQRPDEPDCIYFLKNGRCKYGGTCRYHHPINYHQRRQVDDTRRNIRPTNQDQYRVQNVQYVSQLMPTYTQSTSSEGPVTYLNMDGSQIPQGFQQVQIVSGADGTTSYGLQAAEPTPGSSASSLASSYDTAGSSLELLAGDGPNALWNRVRRNGSGGSLNAYSADVPGRLQQVAPLHNVASEGNMRRHRAGSYGSDCNSSHYDTSTMTSATSMSRNTSAGSWRNERPVDPSRRPPQGSQFGPQLPTTGPRSPQLRGQQDRRSPRGRGQRSEESYEGFTMMTSALLNMLDTPEEIGVTFDDDDDQRYPTASYHSAPPGIDESFERMSLHRHRGDPPPGLEGTEHPSGSSWSSTMQGQGDHHLQHRHGAAGQNGLMHRMADHSSSDPDVGLYLP